MRRRALLSLLAIVFAAGMLLGACDDNDDGDDDESAPPETPELTGPPIKILTIAELSEGVSNPEIPEGIAGAVEAINRDGGINGSPVEFEECDTNDDPNTAAECGRKAVDEGFAAVVGGLTVHGSEFLPLLADNNIPVIGNVLASAADFTSPASFPIYGGIISTSAALPRALAESGAERIVAARIDLAEGAVIPLFGDAALGSLDPPQAYAADVPIPTNAPDMATYVAQVQGADADAVVVAVPGQDALNFLTEMLEADPEILAAMVTTSSDDVREALGDEVADRLVYANPIVSSGEAYDQYVSDMDDAGFDEVGDFRDNMYAATMVFAEIAKTLPEGQVTAQAIWDALPQQTAVTTGLTPPIDFSAPQEIPDSPLEGLRVFNLCEEIAILEDGVAVLQDGFIDPFTGEDCPAP